MIPHGTVVRHVDHLSPSDRKEQHVAEVGYASHRLLRSA
jgi:hypothetical protein